MKVDVIYVISVTMASFHAAVRAIAAMMPLTVIAVALFIAIHFARLMVLRSSFFGSMAVPSYWRLIAASAVIAIAETAVLAVWMIAIQRFLLLSERPSRETITENSLRFLRYAGYLAIAMLLWRLFPLLLLPGL